MPSLRYFRPLTEQDVQDVLSRPVVIGADSQTGVRFVYNPLHHNFCIELRTGDVLFPSPDPTELLSVYNDMIGAIGE